MSGQALSCEWLGRVAYEPLWARLRSRAATVATGGARELICCCEHDPVYTTGRRGVDNRLTARLPAAVVQSDRGGEMTFHGPGQLMLYPVIHLRQRQIGVKAYVALLEASCIALLATLGIAARRRCGFPGVWVGERKIAALGVRVSQGVAYHGMALNVCVEPAWFAAIRPCGLRLGVANLAELRRDPPPLQQLGERWQALLIEQLAQIS